jgi:hypothetical protein
MAIGDSYVIKHEYYVGSSRCTSNLYVTEVTDCQEVTRCLSVANTYWASAGAVWRLFTSGDCRTSRILVYQLTGSQVAPPAAFYPETNQSGARATGCLPASAHYQFRLKPSGTNTRRTPLLKFAGVSGGDVVDDAAIDAVYNGGLVPFASVIDGAITATPPFTGAWNFAARTISAKNNASATDPRFLPVDEVIPSRTIFGLQSRTSNRTGIYQATGD